MKHVFHVPEMLRLAGAQQATPFVPGQRIGPEAAALLNGMRDIAEALKFYQADTLEEATHFVPEPVVLVAPKPVTDEDMHIVSGEKAAALMHTYGIDRDGIKSKLE